MESQSQSHRPQATELEFSPGTSVVYGLHGRCQIVGIESKTIQGNSMSFYKLEVQRSTLARVQRKEPAILVPTSSAVQQGLRLPLHADQASQAIEILSSREYYLNPAENWHLQIPKIEALLRKEGAMGLAKSVSFLFVLRRRQVVPSSDLIKMEEMLTKQLLRELSDALPESIESLEQKLPKWMRSKLLADQ